MDVNTLIVTLLELSLTRVRLLVKLITVKDKKVYLFPWHRDL